MYLLIRAAESGNYYLAPEGYKVIECEQVVGTGSISHDEIAELDEDPDGRRKWVDIPVLRVAAYLGDEKIVDDEIIREFSLGISSFDDVIKDPSEIFYIDKNVNDLRFESIYG